MSSSFTVPPPALDVGSLERRPSIVLSASVPALLDASVYDPADSELVEESNRRYAADARPDRIRAAVSALTRVALGHSPSIRLVFGAHPTISPMILQAAADMDAMNESILVFQSEAYAGLIRMALTLATPRRQRA